MANAETLFQQIYDRQPSDEDRRRLLAAQKAMGLSDDDATWSMLIAFDFYSQRIADKADDLDHREKTHIRNIEKFYQSFKIDVEKLVDAAKQRAQLDAANKISQQTADKIEQKALDIYEHGRRATARRAIADWVGILTMMMMAIIGGVSYTVNQHYKIKFNQMEKDLQEEWSKRFADMARTASNDPYVNLSKNRRENVKAILNEAHKWNAVRNDNKAPFPCLKTYWSEEYVIGENNARVCIVAY